MINFIQKFNTRRNGMLCFSWKFATRFIGVGVRYFVAVGLFYAFIVYSIAYPFVLVIGWIYRYWESDYSTPLRIAIPFAMFFFALYGNGRGIATALPVTLFLFVLFVVLCIASYAAGNYYAKHAN